MLPKRIGPRHPRLGAAVFRLALPLIEQFYRHHNIFRSTSSFAAEQFRSLALRLDRGEPLYLAGINPGGTHNSGAALLEVTRKGGPKIICNNEEERFSAEKHTTRYPQMAVEALIEQARGMGIAPERFDAWFLSWDYPVFGATLLRLALEEGLASITLLNQAEETIADARRLEQVARAGRRIARQIGRREPVPLIAMPHHDNHAWFSFSVSPFARSTEPVMVAVLDGSGDLGAISLYLCGGGRMQQLYCNRSVFDSLGFFYSVISSTQGGWTMLSSEGRYMGAAAYGDSDRATNKFYQSLREILALQPDGDVYLNRALANWRRRWLRTPYTPALTRILGEPIAPSDLWNPDAVLRVEDIQHRPDTQDRLDKAAATQMVFEDALIHVIDHFIRRTGSHRLVLTGGVGFNALANMRLLERFDDAYFERELGRRARLHLWVPPTPNDSGVTMGAAYLGAHRIGGGIGAPLEHAFYCGAAPKAAEIRAAFAAAGDLAWRHVGEVTDARQRGAVADLMAFMTSRDGVFAIIQGAAETGPRALGHRSILANPCNPATRETLNARVKYREAIRPLAPMMTLEAAKRWFVLLDGASDDEYNAYNYMVLTARARPEARSRVPAVIHADGTGRLQIVRERSDPLTYAYLKALGRRIGVEVAVNTSFNVAGPIAQTIAQALDTLRRSKGMDVVLIVAEEGSVFAAWRPDAQAAGSHRFLHWFEAWRAEIGLRGDYCSISTGTEVPQAASPVR
jgi:carbamoyltransferase